MSDPSYSRSTRSPAEAGDLVAALAPAYAGGSGTTVYPGQGHRPGGSTLLSTDEAFDRLAAGTTWFVRHYVRIVDGVNRKVGLFAMYLLFFMMAVLTYAMVANVVIKSPAIWVMEVAQFTMAAYYLLGGGFSMQDDAHVRMDVLRERWGPMTKVRVDAVTDLVVIFYLIVVLSGGVSSSMYAIDYHQKNYTAWAPPMAPIKIIMTSGVLLMLLQAFSQLFKDIAASFGKEIK